MPSALFPFADYWWFYCAFTGLLAFLLAIDLTLHRKAGAIAFREALTWTSVWIALALLFGFGLYLFTASRFSPGIARQVALEYLAGYVVEESLSVDNMFVFALVFRFFAVPSEYQHRVLFYGVLGAMILRAIFIAIGSALVHLHWMMIAFGVFLVFTGLRLTVERDKQIHPGENPVVRLARRLFPVTPGLHGSRFLVRVQGVRHLTPLMIVLLALETTDVVFATDSVPAVFGVTTEPLVVYTSNLFAVLGLRSMYFLLAGAIDRFYALKYGLAFVLMFVGIKMALLDGLAGGRFPIDISLAIITSAVLLSVVASVAWPREPAEGSSPAARPSFQRQVAGGVLLLLCTLDLLVAHGVGRGWFPAQMLEQIHLESLLISATCYAISGVLLFVAPGAAERPRRARRGLLWKGELRRTWAHDQRRHLK